MGKRRRIVEGTSSIKSFFTALGKPEAAPKSSGSSTSPSEESEPEVVASDSDSDWEETSKRKRPRRACTIKKPAAIFPPISSSKIKKNGKRVRKSKTSDSAKNKKPKVDLEALAFLKSGIPSVSQKLEEIWRDEKKKSPKHKEVFVIDDDEEEDEPPEKEVDLEVVAFLKSGVPSATSRVEKIIDCRRHEDELAKKYHYFPAVTHVPEILQPESLPVEWGQNFGVKRRPDSFCTSFSPESNPNSFSEYRKKAEAKFDSCKMLFCCQPPSTDETIFASKSDDPSNLPWIEKYAVRSASHLAVDDQPLEKIKSWLKLWKNDIKDDGGKGRQFQDKRKRKGSESDFITSDEDSEFKTKSLLLWGATGTAKTATVVTLAKSMGFKIVEVNFSTSRSGKDVLKRVEEATLSHRLESTHACLLLFKDISLLEPKEDEGFAAAVAQLITSSCRPIIMTMTRPNDNVTLGGDCDSVVLDVKILKKQPLYVHFQPQPAARVVHKVLIPILEKEFNLPHTKPYEPVLYSIARHCKGDIRLSINQLQLLFQNSNPLQVLSNFHLHLCPSTDLDFLCKCQQTRRRRRPHRRRVIDPEDDASNQEIKGTKSKKQLQEEIKALEALRKKLEAAVDLDRAQYFVGARTHHEFKYDEDLKTGIGQRILSGFDDGFKLMSSLPSHAGSSVDLSQDSGHASDYSPSKQPVMMNDDSVLASLVFDCDKDVELENRVVEINEKLEEYCGNEGDLACLPRNHENFTFARTIIKISKLNATSKRNRRTSLYFNRLGVDVAESIFSTFDFQSELRIASSC